MRIISEKKVEHFLIYRLDSLEQDTQRKDLRLKVKEQCSLETICSMYWHTSTRKHLENSLRLCALPLISSLGRFKSSHINLIHARQIMPSVALI